jgi:class 3 adenylate cyclase/putative methionine-R-sulfoxide reductase with GAF domain
MIPLKLQNILGRRKPAARVISGLLDSLDSNLRVEDNQGQALLGADAASHPDGDGATRQPVMVEDDVLGFVCGPAAGGQPLAATLSLIASNEMEMKQLRSEVLNLYSQINLIHRFSEKLATLLDTASVAQASIEQALQIHKTSAAAILLLNDATEIFEPVAILPLGTEVSAIRSGEGLIGCIAALGNAEIVNDVRSDSRYGGKDPAVSSLICVPLRLKERIQGILLAGSAEPVSYTAGDLQLMSTLGLQTAAAIENAVLYEKTLQAAKTEALQQTLLEVEEQKRKAEAMLLNILPARVALELQQNNRVQPMYFNDVTVCFTDFVGFSKSTRLMASEDLVDELDQYFTAFDLIIERYGLEKLKTIGDSYMFVSGLPERREAHAIDAVLAALEIVETVRNKGRSGTGNSWEIRVGLHTGPVIAGVVGKHKFAFDILGETVNVASRMQSCGEPNRVNVSESTFTKVKDFVKPEPRGHVTTKEGRDIEMYFVEGVREKLLTDRSASPPRLFAELYQRHYRDTAPSFPEFL